MRLLRMVFHHPHPITEDGKSGSQIRPSRMLNAFLESGHQVLSIVGNSDVRKRRFQEIRESNQPIDFVYSETSNSPFALTDPDHIPRNWRLDFKIFRWFKARNIPIGLFYRDIYWKFDLYRENLPLWKWLILSSLFKSEAALLARSTDVLFLPSLEMRNFMPQSLQQLRALALPPGTDPSVSSFVPLEKNRESLNLIYVGSITPPLYDISGALKLVASLSALSLTIVTRKNELESQREYYQDLLATCGHRVRTESSTSSSISKFYETADVSLNLFPPSDYRSFAVPLKTMESFSFGVPVLATAGSFSAKIIENHKLGWVVRNTLEAKTAILELMEKRELLPAARLRIKDYVEANSWKRRAEFVSETLRRPHSNLLIEAAPRFDENCTARI